MESDQHLWQILILLQCLKHLWRDREDYYAAGNMTLYYSPEMVKNRDFRGPDFMVVLGVENRPRRSWTVWEEGGKYPDFILEVLSDSTAKVDRTTKKDLYARLGVAEYFWFDPESQEFVGHRLVGVEYQRITANDRGHLWSETLELWLGRHNWKLRYFLKTGELVLTLEEENGAVTQERDRVSQKYDRVTQKYDRVTQERDRVMQERDRVTQKYDRVTQERDRLLAKLRELGIDPEKL
jgi:Uma2 family endonuclease